MFDDIRLWSEGDRFDDRIVWIECYGIHPICWSEENVRRIGEKWGLVLSIDNRVDGLCSLTYARMLVRTKVQNKIDTRIRILFDHGSCDVWVKESSYLCGKYSRCDKNICKAIVGVSGLKESHQVSVPGNGPESAGNTYTQSACAEPVDPQISDVLN